MDVQPQLNVATIAEESSLLHYYRRFSRPKIGPKSPIAHSVESDKQLSEGLENSPKSPEIADFHDLLLFTPTCGFAKWRAEKAG